MRSILHGAFPCLPAVPLCQQGAPATFNFRDNWVCIFVAYQVLMFSFGDQLPGLIGLSYLLDFCLKLLFSMMNCT